MSTLHKLTCKCKEHGKRWCWSCFAFTAGFPIEHFIWEKLPVFRSITAYLGLVP